MANKFLTAIDLVGNQLLNVLLQQLAAAPSPAASRLYYDTTLGTARVYNGTAWVNLDPTKAAIGSIPLNTLVTDPLARANHTGTQSAGTISNLASTVQGYSLNLFAAPTSAFNLNNQELINLGAPTAGTSATSKTYVDNAVANAKAGLDVKDSVRAATTANIVLSGTQVIDGVSLAVGDRVLVKNQTNMTQNVIYLVQTGAWTTAPDSTNGFLTSEAFVFVEEGSTQAGAQYRVTTTGAITVGTTNVTWTQFGGGISYTAGNGITIGGNVITVVAAPSGGLTVGASGVGIDNTVVARKYTSPAIGDGSLTSFTVTHNLSNQRPEVTIWEVSSNQLVNTDVVASTVNTLTVTFGVAPTVGQYVVAVMG